jgi:uncharacterized DUF497 family protein
MEFEWDPQKADANLSKHKVSFHEAATVFSDPFSITVPDPDHSKDEERFIIVGLSYQHRLLIVAFTEREDRFRIISARELTRTEKEAYEQSDFEL